MKQAFIIATLLQIILIAIQILLWTNLVDQSDRLVEQYKEINEVIKNDYTEHFYNSSSVLNFYNEETKEFSSKDVKHLFEIMFKYKK